MCRSINADRETLGRAAGSNQPMGTDPFVARRCAAPTPLGQGACRACVGRCRAGAAAYLMAEEQVAGDVQRRRHREVLTGQGGHVALPLDAIARERMMDSSPAAPKGVSALTASGGDEAVTPPGYRVEWCRAAFPGLTGPA